MKRKRGSRAPIVLVTLLVVAALAGAGWFLLHRRPHSAPLWPDATVTKSAPSAPIVVATDHVDPGNEGRGVVVSGALHVTGPARDRKLGISADALALLRQVEMRQWSEKCAAAACDYALIWSTSRSTGKRSAYATAMKTRCRFRFPANAFSPPA